MNSLHQRLTVPEPERRGAVQRFNDRTMEYVIMALRLISLIATLSGWTPALVAWVWTGDWRWGATLAVLIVAGLGAGYFGFWVFGNEEWRRGDPH